MVAVALATILAVGCDTGPTMGVVSGTITIDGEVAPVGSSITFIPTEGAGPTAGAMVEEGKYTAEVPVGTSKVEIRAPRELGIRFAQREGPGSEEAGGTGQIRESLPPRYNDNTELTFDVQKGENLKDWDLSTK